MDVPNEINVLRREVSRLLHEKINAHIEPTSLDKYTLGTDLATIEDMYTAISCLRSHILEVDARANKRIEENEQQLAADYQLFNALTSQAKNTISALAAQKSDAEAREASVCVLEGSLLSRLLSTEAQLTARAEVAEAMERAHKDQFTKAIEMYTTLLESFKVTKKKLERLSCENTLLRQNNLRFTSELIMLHEDHNAAHERADNTLSMYTTLGEKLSKILDQWLSYHTNNLYNTSDVITELRNINNSVEEIQRETSAIASDLRHTVTDQEAIIAALTTELDALQNKELESKIDSAKLCFLETENDRLLRELASLRYSSGCPASSNMKSETVEVSTQTVEQSGVCLNNNCNTIDSTS